MSEYTDEDVLAVASALMKVHFVSDGDYGKNSYKMCRFCGGEVSLFEPVTSVQHRPDCVVLIAKKLLAYGV